VRALALLLALAGAAAATEWKDEKVAVLEAFPRRVARGGSLALRGALGAGFSGPELIVLAPRGQTFLAPDPTVDGASFTFTVRFEHGTGPYRMELVATDRFGMRSAARFTVFHGVPVVPDEKLPPLPVALPIPAGVHERLVERQLFDRLNAFRRSIGEKPAEWCEPVAARAREHARRMAAAEQRLHRIGGTGVAELLLQPEPPGAALSSAYAWGRISQRRPFPPPSPAPPGPRVENRLVDCVFDEHSVDYVMERYFVREASFRILAADPHLREIAVGCARNPARATPVYMVVCFVQINETTLRERIDRDFEGALRAAREKTPEALRALAGWHRPNRTLPLLRDALRADDAALVAAGLDGLLLVDEAEARERIASMSAGAAARLEKGAYAEAVAALAAFAHVTYDRDVPSARERIESLAATRAREEAFRAAKEADPNRRAAALADLLARCGDLPVAAEVRRRLEG
jgi:hypothetical protein